MPAIAVAGAAPAFAASPCSPNTGLAVFAADYGTPTQTGLTITESYPDYVCSTIGTGSFRVWTVSWTVTNTSTRTIFDIQLAMPYMGTRYKVDSSGVQNTSCFTPTTYVGAGTGSYANRAWWSGPASVSWPGLGTYGYDDGRTTSYDVGVGAGTGATMSYKTISGYGTKIPTSVSGVGRINPYYSTTAGSNTTGAGTRWSMCSSYTIPSTASIPVFTPTTSSLAAGSSVTFTTRLYMEGEATLGDCQRVNDNFLGVVLLANKCA